MDSLAALKSACMLQPDGFNWLLADSCLTVLCCATLCCLALQLLNSLSQQLAGAPLTASPGSVHCLLLQLVPTAKAQEPVSMGRLKVSWRRKEQPSPAGSSSSGGGSSSSAAVAAAAAMDAWPIPAMDVETSLLLPPVVVQDSLLSVKASGPQNVTAGTSFPFTLQVRCCCQQLTVTLGWQHKGSDAVCWCGTDCSGGL
jgi:hypothetical protein